MSDETKSALPSQPGSSPAPIENRLLAAAAKYRAAVADKANAEKDVAAALRARDAAATAYKTAVHLSEAAGRAISTAKKEVNEIMLELPE